MSIRAGITEAELQAQRDRQQAIAAAEKAVVEAPKQWVGNDYEERLVEAVRALRKLEASR